MANHFYSNQMSEDPNGTLVPSLGNSHNYGVTEKYHKCRVDVPLGRTFAVDDKIVFLSVPTDWKPRHVYCSGSLWPSGVITIGVFKFNEDGSIGDKVSANSDDLLSVPLAISTVAFQGFTDYFPLGPLHFLDAGLQLWELVNIVDPGTYARNPGGNVAIAAVFTTGTTTVTAELIQLEVEYSSTGN